MTDTTSMDVSDAYLKLREQILAYNSPHSELERTGGLNLINTSNLLYFDALQKSELFRLKAIFLSSLRRTSKSNQAYCHSVQICPLHSKAWISWGGLCSSLGTLTESAAEQAASNTGGTSESGKVRHHGGVMETERRDDLVAHSFCPQPVVLNRSTSSFLPITKGCTGSCGEKSVAISCTGHGVLFGSCSD